MKQPCFFRAVLMVVFSLSATAASDQPDDLVCQIKLRDIQYEDSGGDQEYRCVVESEQDGYNIDLTYSVVLDDDSVATMKTDLQSGNVYATIPEGTLSRKKGSRDRVVIPPGSMVKLSKEPPKRKQKTHSKKRDGHKHRKLRNKSQSRRLKAQKTGTSKVLVIRVSAMDHNATLSAKELSNRIFGVGGDKVNLISIFDKCSAGKLKLIPAVGDYIVNGVGEIVLPQRIDGMSSVDVDNLVVSLGNAKFGELSSLYDHVMLCLPPGTSGKWVAYGYVNWYRSSYNDVWCGFPSAQAHEIGHNLGLMHSNENGTAYGDQSSLMGYSYAINEGPQMCFDGHKSWILGWYGDRQIIVDPISQGSWTGKLAAFVDYKATSPTEYVVVKVGNLHLLYNRKKDFNSGTVEKADQVSITEGLSTRSVSNSVAGLGMGDSYRHERYDGSNALIIEVCGIATNVIPNYVNISIFIEGRGKSQCNQVSSPSPSLPLSRPTPTVHAPTMKPISSKSPTTLPPSTVRPTLSLIRPSLPPSSNPTLFPTVDPTKLPTLISGSPPVLRSMEPSIYPSSIPTTSPSTLPSTALSSALPSMILFTQTPRVFTSAPSQTPWTPFPSSFPLIIRTPVTTAIPSMVVVPSKAPSTSPSVSKWRFLECPSNETKFQLSVITDQFPGETEWELTNLKKTFAAKGGPYERAFNEYMESMCIPDGSYVFRMKDKYGDGICCKHGAGSYNVFVDGVHVVSGGEFRAIEETRLGHRCASGEDPLRVEVKTDFFGSETSWTLETLSGSLLMSGSGYKSWRTYEDTKCLDSSLCYVFTIRDAWGDGMCCSYGSGGYSIVFGRVTHAGSFPDGSSSEVRIGSSCASSTIIDSVKRRRREDHKPRKVHP